MWSFGNGNGVYGGFLGVKFFARYSGGFVGGFEKNGVQKVVFSW
jgi:hypothetical protein